MNLWLYIINITFILYFNKQVNIIEIYITLNEYYFNTY